MNPEERVTPLRIYRRVFTGFLEVPSPPGKGEKVAEGRMRGLLGSKVKPSND